MIDIDLYIYGNNIHVKRFNQLTFRNIINYIMKRDLHVCGIDPSKSGYGITFLERSGAEAYSLEIKGADVELDEFSSFLNEFWEFMLRIVNFRICGQEKVILSKAYTPMVVLNEIRVVSKEVFSRFGYKLQEVNSNTWKYSILPKELRKKSVHKGSLEYCRHNLSFNFKSDNITDSICIAKYLFKTDGIAMDIIPDRIIQTNEPALCFFSNKSLNLPLFTINFGLSLQENANFIKEVIKHSMCSKVYLSQLELSEIYKTEALVDNYDIMKEDVNEVFFNVIAGGIK